MWRLLWIMAGIERGDNVGSEMLRSQCVKMFGYFRVALHRLNVFRVSLSICLPLHLWIETHSQYGILWSCPTLLGRVEDYRVDLSQDGWKTKVCQICSLTIDRVFFVLECLLITGVMQMQLGLWYPTSCRLPLYAGSSHLWRRYEVACIMG